MFERSNSASPTNPQAARRDAPVKCAECDKRFVRKALHQTFCSRKCRQRAAYKKSVAEGFFNNGWGVDTGLPTHPPAKPLKSHNGWTPKSGSNHRIYGPRRVIDAELFAGRDCTPIVSPDGVVVEVAIARGGRP